jgi:peptidylprolyl isomerase
MLKRVKFWIFSVVMGLVMGFITVGWMYSHRSPHLVTKVARNGADTEPTSQSQLSTSGIGSSQSSSGLSVSSDGDQGEVMGNTSSTSSPSSDGAADDATNSNSQASPAPTPAASTLPNPDEFNVYDKFINNSTALYEDVQMGTGKAVTDGSVVTVQYRGYLTNGTEFDSSYNSGKAFTFTEGGGNVIPGWEEGIYGMKPNGQRRIIVPPSQGYGSTVHGPIPANSLLIFDVLVVSVQ